MWKGLFSTFHKTCKDYSEDIALVYLGSYWRYEELLDLVHKFSYSLQNIGISSKEKVLIYIPNSPQWIISWFSILKLGAISVPISPIYTPSDIEYIANDCGAETVICLDVNFRYVYHILEKSQIKRVIVTNIADMIPMWKRVIGIAFDKIPRGRVAKEEGIFQFKELLRIGRKGGTKDEFEPIEPKDLAAIFYTGGTTGMPKGIPYSHRFIYETATCQRRLRHLIPNGDDILIQGAPLFHSFGMAMCMGSLLSGDTVVMLPRVNLDALFEQISKYRAKSFFGVPTLFKMILDHERLDLYDLSSLKYCCSGGDALPIETAHRWKKRFKVPLYQGYGSTETGGIAGVMMGDNPPEGSCGKILPHQRIRFEEDGELLVSSVYMPSYYWNKPEETERCFIRIEGNIWYKTGDIVKIDKDGWVYFIDRSSDIIKHKGYRVSCSEIETVLQSHPAVLMASVVGVPDKDVGERIKAYVVLKEDIKGVSAYELTRWCKERLTYYKVPHAIEFRDMLPRSKVGKILRKELREWERRRTAQQSIGV